MHVHPLGEESMKTPFDNPYPYENNLSIILKNNCTMFLEGHVFIHKTLDILCQSTLLCSAMSMYFLDYLSRVQPTYVQVQGVIQDRSGRTVATLFGKWDESMHYVMGDCFGKGKGSENFSEAHLLWKRSKPPKFPTRYNLTSFAITLNELTPGLKVCVSLLPSY
jgi:hypothetical protein